MCTYGEKIGQRKETQQDKYQMLQLCLRHIGLQSLYAQVALFLKLLIHFQLLVFHHPVCISSQQIYQFLKYLNNFGPKMQLNHHPHYFYMVNTRALDLMPNLSDTQVPTLIECSHHDNFLPCFQYNVSVYSQPWLSRNNIGRTSCPKTQRSTLLPLPQCWN